LARELSEPGDTVTGLNLSPKELQHAVSASVIPDDGKPGTAGVPERHRDLQPGRGWVRHDIAHDWVAADSLILLVFALDVYWLGEFMWPIKSAWFGAAILRELYLG
jgi:hypothetical protein